MCVSNSHESRVQALCHIRILRLAVYL